ncbi:hypothetical protein K491DRAFT_763462 [Lophiostoma macrostomum CBS 122681]|uniref:Uncharacterized protein n=1 Tax=Lophiostoma macrostomum CBS 122681 TaxID=1314788 RepID=A0A6A6SJ57_9PLEO|nr:hypothetical protein K491DRAFT_763462 [Lophiostoma macrostomum CBS 122681]
MSSVRRRKDRPRLVSSLCRTLCIWTAWVHGATALPQAGADSNGPVGSASVALALISSAPGLIPSAPKITALIPSAPPQSAPAASATILSSQTQPPGLIPSQPVVSSQPPGLIPSAPPSGLIPSAPPSGLIPSAPPPSEPAPGSYVSGTQGTSVVPTGVPIVPTDAVTTTMPPVLSTDEGLHPIPPATTATGDPDGHHEISEPNFTVTVPCKGCSPVVEISATGFYDWPTTPAAEHADTTAPSIASTTTAAVAPPPPATITVGPSQVIVSQEPSGSNFVIGTSGGSTTITAGQTITVDKTPLVIQTSFGKTEIVVAGPSDSTGTAAGSQPAGPLTIPLPTPSPSSSNSNPQITDGPILVPLTIGAATVTANTASQYILAGQTLAPGGPAITVDGTIVSLLPSATGLVINGATTTLQQVYGSVYTTTSSPVLTLDGQTYTANRAGYYVLAPGTTLIPGGPAVTVSGSVISLLAKGTAAVIQGSTSAMAPVTTVVTSTRSGAGALGGGGAGGSAGGSWTSVPGQLPPLSTSKHGDAGVVRIAPGFGLRGGVGAEGWLEGVVLLGVMGVAWLAVWL